MDVEQLAIPDVLLLRSSVHKDPRGYFMETWHEARYRDAKLAAGFVQDNHSTSVQWTLRGLHYQLPHPQGKLVHVARGRILDVAVDLREASEHFGRWVAHVLEAGSGEEVWIPEGFAHGFLVLSEEADVIYKCTDYFSPDSEHCIRWDDAELAIQWGLPDGVAPLLSDRDRAGMSFRDAPHFPRTA